MRQPKRHRIVLDMDAFLRTYELSTARAMECAENEGWPMASNADLSALLLANDRALRFIEQLTTQQPKTDSQHFPNRATLLGT